MKEKIPRVASPESEIYQMPTDILGKVASSAEGKPDLPPIAGGAPTPEEKEILVAQAKAQAEYERRLRLAAERADKEFAFTDFERREAMTPRQINQTQTSMGRLKQRTKADENPYESKISWYDEKVAKESHDFVGLLVSPAVQKQLKNVRLNEAGFDMISFFLTDNEAPSPRTLVGIKNAVDEQEIEPVKPADNSGKAQTPRYKSAKGMRFGPFESKEQDVVVKVLEILQPEHWQLTDQDRKFWKEVGKTTDLAKPEKEPADFSYRSFVFNIPIVGPRLSKSFHEWYRDVKKKPSLSPKEQEEWDQKIERTQKIKEWWINSSDRRKAKASEVNDDQTILAAARNHARRLLSLEKCLRQDPEHQRIKSY